MIIHLLSNPRNVSTALMYAFAQHPEFSVVDEPFYGHYLASTGLNHPGRQAVLESRPTSVHETLNWLEELSGRNRHLFIKNMAHHLRQVPLEDLPGDVFILFLRHPRDVLASFCKVIAHPGLDDIAIKDQFQLFQDLKILGRQTILLDAKVLLGSPSLVLKKVAEVAGFDFDPTMLSWPAGAKPYDGRWAPWWYKNVHKSTGFTPLGHYGINDLPTTVGAVLDEALPFYDKLLRAPEYLTLNE